MWYESSWYQFLVNKRNSFKLLHNFPSLDNYMRQHKKSGAWMSAFRTQSRSGSADGSSIIPIICNNNNFAKGSEVYTTISVIKWIVHSITIFVVGLLFLYLSKNHSYSLTPTFLYLCLSHFSLCQGAPTLLSFDDARTLFHEFGSVIFCLFIFSTTSSTAWSKANYFIIFLSTHIKRVLQIIVIHLLAFLPLSYWTSHWICLNLSLSESSILPYTSNCLLNCTVTSMTSAMECMECYLM